MAFTLAQQQAAQTAARLGMLSGNPRQALTYLGGAPAAYWDARYPNGFGVANPSDGDPLGTWVDLSGNGHDVTQSTSTKQPVWHSDGRLTFDGVDDTLLSSSWTFTSDGLCTTYVHYNVASGGKVYALPFNHGSTINSVGTEHNSYIAINRLNNSANTSMRMDRFAAGNKAAIVGASWTVGPHAAVLISRYDSFSVTIDGVTATFNGSPPPDALTGPTQFGAQFSDVTFTPFAGDVVAVVMYPTIHNAAQIAQISDYLHGLS